MKLRAAAAALLLSATALRGGSTITARSAALSTPSPYATSVGVSVLSRGGNAVDAAVAAAFALAVVSPHASGIGGGGFLVYYDAASKGVWTLDFRESAPRAANAQMFANPADARIGPHAAGVPGEVAGLSAAHGRFGSRPWKELLEPAIALAAEGARVDLDLQAALAAERQARKIDQFPSTAALFYPGGQAPAAGTKLVQHDLAATLSRIAAVGAAGFYDGETARRLVESSRAAGGTLSFRDLRDYAPVWRAPVKIAFGDDDIYTVPPPSSGGVILAETLNILSGLGASGANVPPARTIHLQAEAERRAFLDASRYLADPAMARLPYRDLLSADRAERWRGSIDVAHATSTASLVDIAAATAQPHTAQISIADAAGNLVALTTTLGDEFGSGFVVPGCGFVLNDAMASFTAGVNAIEPGKRPLSAATPTLVVRGGKPLMAIGASGGPAIPAAVLQILLSTLTAGTPLGEAVAAPRYRHQADPEEIFYEASGTAPAVLAALASMGHGVRVEKSPADVHAVMVTGDGIIAVADPRHGGAAGGY